MKNTFAVQGKVFISLYKTYVHCDVDDINDKKKYLIVSAVFYILVVYTTHRTMLKFASLESKEFCFFFFLIVLLRFRLNIRSGQ